MNNKLTHFAIHIDDIERAKSFYDGVFDWGFNSYGQGDFLQIKADKSENGELIGALQSRKYSPVPEKVIGLECSIGVENIDEIIEKVKSNGGQVVMPKTAIPYVGYLAKFLDTEGNLIVSARTTAYCPRFLSKRTLPQTATHDQTSKSTRTDVQ